MIRERQQERQRERREWKRNEREVLQARRGLGREGGNLLCGLAKSYVWTLERSNDSLKGLGSEKDESIPSKSPRRVRKCFTHCSVSEENVGTQRGIYRKRREGNRKENK